MKQKFVSECTFCKEERQSAVCEDVRVGGGSCDCGTHLASTISARDVGSEHSPWLASPPASDTVSCISIKIHCTSTTHSGRLGVVVSMKKWTVRLARLKF